MEGVLLLAGGLWLLAWWWAVRRIEARMEIVGKQIARLRRGEDRAHEQKSKEAV